MRMLVERYLAAGYKRVVLDEYLDGRIDRERYKEGEEEYEGCRVSKGGKGSNIEQVSNEVSNEVGNAVS